MSTENTAVQSEEYRQASRAKPCINCKHVTGVHFYYCGHPDVAPPDIVAGIKSMLCENGRAPQGNCGVSGRFFEASQTQERTSE